MKAITKIELSDQDWKTQLARGYPNIPAGEEVTIINEDYINFYGTWCEVLWNNNRYYVSKQNLKIL